MIGTDLTNKNRIANAYDKHGTRFAEKVLHREELIELQSKKDPIRYLAMRWAAKEAFAKALGTGLRSPILMPNIQIAHDELGAPFFSFNSAIAEIVQTHGYRKIHLSLSDEQDYALAFVVAEK